MTLIVPIRRGDAVVAVSMIDDRDVDILLERTWRLHSAGYTCVWPTVDGCELMHRRIMQAPDHLEVDHINRDRLDNRRCNLRLVERSDQFANRGCHRSSSAFGFRGVCKNGNAWRARLIRRGRVVVNKRFGNAADAVQAVRAYRKVEEMEINRRSAHLLASLPEGDLHA